MQKKQIDEIVTVWQKYLHAVNNWQDLVIGVTPIQGGCGDVYELDNPIERPGESFAIADMRSIPFAEPHYHKGIEIYFVLHGTGLLVVGGKEQKIQKGSAVVISPDNAHFTIPDADLVIAAVNKPAFRIDDYLVVDETNTAVKFDKEQFDRLTTQQ